MNALERKIYKMRPSYLLRYDDFVHRHSQYGGGSKGEKYESGRTFSNVYELYIYAFFLGLKENARASILEDDDKKSFWEIENWKPAELVDSLLICAFSEYPGDIQKIENMEDSEIAEVVNKVRLTIEEYANGGLAYLAGLFESQPDLVDDDMLFITLLSES